MKLPDRVTRAVGRQILVAKKNSPHIFFVGGVVGVAASAVLACRATLKLEQVLEETKEDIVSVKAKSDANNYNKNLATAYGVSAAKMVKLYGPSVALGAASIAALTGSHVQLTRRNSALSATIALVSQSFEDYRGRVREEFGEEKELDLYQGVSTKELEIDGKKQSVKILDPDHISPYARVFDGRSSINWEKNNEINWAFLQCQENYANHKLKARGHVLLNEVYEALGFEHTKEGCVVGWIWQGDGDNFIDFGLTDPARKLYTGSGTEMGYLLDFNVDGVIYDKI